MNLYFIIFCSDHLSCLTLDGLFFGFAGNYCLLSLFWCCGDKRPYFLALPLHSGSLGLHNDETKAAFISIRQLVLHVGQRSGTIHHLKLYGFWQSMRLFIVSRDRGTISFSTKLQFRRLLSLRTLTGISSTPSQPGENWRNSRISWPFGY